MKRILVVDDNPISRELVKEVFSPQDYEVLEASNGQAALARVAETCPDLVLLDIQMPGLDGFGVMRKLRQSPELAALRIAALTASAMRGEEEKALAAGFDAYITKPIKPADLRSQVEKLLS